MKKSIVSLVFALVSTAFLLPAQNFYFGADLSYVNEMNDCGVVFKENNLPKDCYQIFADHQFNLVRVRLWHTPSWYDTLNAGKRYSDFNDVKRSILRAKTAGMKVLLDFHLSDFWADPQRQLIPNAWLPVVDNLPVLKDSLFNYVKNTLLALDSEGLLPEMVQIGNETNKGIMLSPTVDAAGWSLDWTRNAALFKRAIEAVRAVETASSKKIKVALHIAGPADAGWLMQGFWSHGVTDFDVIGLSYYWAWHKPTTIAETGNVITQLKTLYAGKQVMIFETGYIWTTAGNDPMNNIITVTHPDYAPASPANQKKWCVDLTKEVIAKGGSGVVYWEPAWVSSPCFTPWGQGSAQEHATFFDFQTNLLNDGGIAWPSEDFGISGTKTPSDLHLKRLRVVADSAQQKLQISADDFQEKRPFDVQLSSNDGRVVATQHFNAGIDFPIEFSMPANLSTGVYFVSIVAEGKVLGAASVFW